jgi:hypothetical protein
MNKKQMLHVGHYLERGFSKDCGIPLHNAASFFIGYSYNFCWPVRTLSQKDIEGNWRNRIPAMAACLTDHIWTLEKWL